MMLAFDHIGIVTPDIDQGLLHLRRVIAICDATERFDDSILTVSVLFLRDRDGIVYELIAPYGEGSIVSRPLRKRSDLINQLAYRTSSLDDSAADMRPHGYFPLGEPLPALAFGGARVQFFMAPLGFIIELIEAPSHVHAFSPLAPSIDDQPKSVGLEA